MPPRIDTSIAASTASDVSAPRSPDAAASPTIKKRAHRVSRACDFCHSRSIRCRPSDTNSSSCKSCIEYDRRCTYDRPSRKRGVKSQPSRATAPVSFSQAVAGPSLDTTNTVTPLTIPDSLTVGMITDFVEIYFELVYPVYPLFHRQTLLRRISRAEHNHDRAFFGALMSLCGLVSARIRDGASFARKLPQDAPARAPTPEDFIELAEAAIPKESQAYDGIDHLRSYALLAILAVQQGNERQMKYFLGLYHTLVQVDGIDQESNWPASLSQIEIEERRRLFWSMYTFELSTAVSFGRGIWCREAHASVTYPTEVDDEDLTDDSAAGTKPSSPSQSFASTLQTTTATSNTSPFPHSWLVGWTFNVDLYRTFEHALDRQRAFSIGNNSVKARSLFHAHEASNDTILNNMMLRYSALPGQFKEIRNVTFEPREDRYGFQAVNIALAIQLVRMVLFTTETSAIADRITVVDGILTTFSEVPIGYTKAMGLPLIHNLASVGTLLAQTLQGPLIEQEYHQIRASLVKLVNLLSGLGQGVQHGDQPSQRVRAQIEKLDVYIRSQNQRMLATPKLVDQMKQLSQMSGVGGPAVQDQQALPAGSGEQNNAAALAGSLMNPEY